MTATIPRPPSYRNSGSARNLPILLTGVLGSAIFVLTVVLGGVITPGYSHLRHAVSELTQAGAKNNAVLLSALFILSALCFLVFGAAVYRTYHRRRERVAVGGTMIELYAVQAVLLASVCPQDPIGSEATFPGAMHLVLVGTSALCIVAAMLLVGFGVGSSGASHWRGFRLYSISSLVVMLVSGASTGILIANGIDLLGLAERVTQLAYLQWFVVAGYKMYLDPAPARR